MPRWVNDRATWRPRGPGTSPTVHLSSSSSCVRPVTCRLLCPSNKHEVGILKDVGERVGRGSSHPAVGMKWETSCSGN